MVFYLKLVGNILRKIAEQNNLEILATKALFGGDINKVYRLETDEGDYVVKYNDVQKFPGMFEAERKGLELLRQTNSFTIPKVTTHNRIENTAYLLMEYLPSGKKTDSFWQSFAKKLVKLHKTTSSSYGLEHDNYIGSLPQYNETHTYAAEFYILQRLEPQFRMAVENGFRFSNLESFYTVVSNEIPEEPSSLVHGDLWNGNYMVSINGKPVLIDPAVSFASREMDLAMMQLFGGFPAEVFEVYDENFPLEYDWQHRTSLWQLYYLVVHLNLFGAGYLHQVEAVLRKYR